MTNDRLGRQSAPFHGIPTRISRTAAIAVLSVTAAACSPAVAPSTSPGASGAPTGAPTPSATPAVGAINHPTSAKDVVLRMESGGGGLVGLAATEAPSFTLYGDGTVVFRDPFAPAPEPIGGVNRLVPFQVVKLSEDGIQALLGQALGPGGLGVAAASYIGQGADIPITLFTIAVDGKTKTVSVMGLSPELHPQNALIVGTLAQLAEKLGRFGQDVPGEEPYVPASYRGILIAADQPIGPVVAWPWPDLELDAFGSDHNEFFKTRTMSPAEITALGIPNFEGGFTGITLEKDGKLFTFLLRPLLPDEAA
jgi:hypothetical protein